MRNYGVLLVHLLVFPLKILSVLLHLNVTLSVTLTEGLTLRKSKNRAPRIIFEIKREGVTGGCRKSCTKEVYNAKYFSRIITVIRSRERRWEVYAACRGDMRISHKILVKKAQS
jgi:hypothetical protein